MAEDWSVFFNTDEFADDVVLVNQGGTVRGIFNDPTTAGHLAQERQTFAPLKIFIEGPHIIVPAEWIRSYHLAAGDPITTQGRDFELVAPPQKDGTGLAILELTEPRAHNSEKAWQA